MVTVRVFSKSSGKAIKGKKVSVSFDGLLRGMATEYTDSSGDAHFNVEPGSGLVYVDGNTVYKGNLAGRVVVYV